MKTIDQFVDEVRAGISGDRFGYMVRGDIRREFIGDHVIEVVKLGRAFKVRCTSCAVMVHPCTNGPAFIVGYHVRNPDDAWLEKGELSPAVVADAPLISCEACNGLGVERHTGQGRCPACDGTGAAFDVVTLLEGR